MNGENRILRQLRRVASKLTFDTELQKDLVQEMFLHFIQVQTRRPSETLSWYIKGCEYHARNYLKLGSSIDSHKRAGSAMSLSEMTVHMRAHSSNGTDLVDPMDIQGELITSDIADHILQHLTMRQQQVLFLLMKGLGLREVGRTLGISHPAVIKHRNKIARIAREFLSESSPIAVAGLMTDSSDSR